MRVLLKYLKKSSLMIVFVFVLLFSQAICDLALPSYTSDIVNVGVQQGGISSVVPEAIRQDQMDKVLLFTKEDDKILSYYKYIEINDSEYINKYPILENEAIYILSKNQDAELEELLMTPLMVLYALQNDESIVNGIKEQTNFEGDIFLLFANLTDEQLTEMFSNYEEMPESLVSQTGVAFVKSEYQAIGMNTEEIQTNYILITGLKMLGIALASMAITILTGYLGAVISARLGRDLRKEVFSKVTSFSNTEFNKFSTASLITRSTNDIQQIQTLLVMLLRTVFYAPIMAVGALIKVMNTNTSMGWIIAVAIVALLSLVIILLGITLPKFQKMQTLVDKLNLVAREILNGIPVIRAFGRDKHEEERFDRANKDLTKNSLFVNRMMSLMMPMMVLIMNVITILIVWNSASYIDAGTMQVGDMVAFMQYTMEIIMSFLFIAMLSIVLPRAIVSIKRVDEVITTDVVIKDPEVAKKFDKNKKGYVEFRNVCFRYPDADYDVITDVNFVAKPGETTALIGSTGSGKSTVINLIPRFFDITGGSILVDGVDIRDVKIKDLRKKIGYAPQKGILFKGTIASNVSFGDRKISNDEVKEALKIAQASDFVGKLEEKENSYISQGGTNVSGGQKQRISIARAIADKPDIYIFDDSFSALDFKTDVKLRSALSKTTKDSTIIIVAQRISTIMHAEQIIVMDEGKIAGIGTHSELLEKCPVYNEIASSQLSKEELAHE